MVKAIYAFSGDPITYGHVNIVERAAANFDEVIVGIGANPDKNYMFNLEERTEMANKSLSKIKNAHVKPFKGLLVDFAYENNIPVVVKGVRNSADFDYEQILHQVGETQKLGIETHILFARPELAHISSSVVKAIQKEKGLVHEYVPLNVKQKLEERMSNQYILGLTGEIGSGKSYVADKFIELGKKKGIEVHNIDLDVIGHQILGELKEPRYQEVRNKIVNIFGNNMRNSDGTINRKELGNIVFNNPAELEKLNQLMYTPLLVRLRRELYDKQGLVLLNGALIAESDFSYLSNNNTILVHTDKQSQKRRLGQRNLSKEQIQRRLKSQFDTNQKLHRLTENIKKHNHGNLYILGNSDNLTSNEINQTFNKVIETLGVK